MRRFQVLLAALAVFLGSQAHAAPTHIAAELIAESDRPAAGKTVALAFVMTPQPGWHGYWKNPGDAGVETRAIWTLPAGVTAGPLEYPVPQKLMVGGLMNYVYEGPYAELVPLTLPAGLAPGTRLPITVKLDWLACTAEICVPETTTLSIVLTLGDGAIAPERRARFDRFRAALPRPLGSAAMFQQVGKQLRIGIPWPREADPGEAWFFAQTDGAIDYAAPQRAGRAGDLLVIETAGGASVPAAELSGVLRIGEGRGVFLTAQPGTVPAATTPVGGDGTVKDAGTHRAGLGTMLAALGAAILGGLILNIMPCVFPILSLKALGLARAGADERTARSEALAYSAGVIAVCLALGAILLGLRAAGVAAGWAFQLQDPRIVLVLLLLVSAIAFNLAGLFELPSVTAGDRLARAGGASGAFWTGALAAFVATPCTGPFMAGALGAALVLPAAAALAIFAGLGLGLALPFLLIGFVPAIRRALPRPGPWMARLRHILSVPMFLTAIGLAWVLGRQAGVDAMTLGLLAALILMLGCWWMGRRQASGMRAAWIPIAPALVLALATVPVLPASSKGARSAETAAAGAPERFDEARLASLRAEGKPVFLYFTADWCLTCKVNEKAAIERQEVADSFRRGGVVTMAGDWTDGDAAIGRFLATHGRSGVPLYLYYPKGAADPQVLPQVLTPGLLAGLAA